MKNNFYVTTPIFYPTGEPHIGTAYNVFIADTLARYHRLNGDDTFFLTGMDEHGGNIDGKAREAGIEPQEYVDKYADMYRRVWKDLGISNDYFIRTTDSRHEQFAAELIQKAYDNGDLYEGKYEGWYCESDETFYAEDDLIDGKCPNHPTKTPVWTSEKNYYFRLSKYQDWLLEYYDQHPDFVRPQKWADYARGMVKAGLQDIPVTRANVKWGVQVPFAPEQTIYVWYDALPNYLSVLFFPEFSVDGYYEKFWREARHVVGKDIIKFHAVLWPAMLRSAGYELPRQVLVHGFFTVNGQKIGKSNQNAIDPRELAERFGIDAVRYALLSEFQVGSDGDFSFARLESKYNTELADNWGNLLNRVIHLAVNKDIDLNREDVLIPEVTKRADAAFSLYQEHMEALELFDAIRVVNELVSYGNKFITEKQPWDKAVPTEDATAVIVSLGYLLSIVNRAFAPVMPESAEKARSALEAREKVILFPKLEDKPA